MLGVLTALTLASGFWAYRAYESKAAWSAIAAARAELQRGQPARALAVIAGLPERGPWAADLLTARGLAYAGLDRPEAARPVLERALTLNPRQAMAAKVLAAVYLSANETERGLAMLTLAARSDPADFQPWFAAGDVLLHLQNQPETAVTDFREALKRRPDHEGSRLGLIEALIAVGQHTEAAPLLAAARQADPSNPRLLRLAARQARLRGDPEALAALAQETLALDPEDAEARVMLGQYWLARGDLPEALAQAEAAVGSSPNDLAALSLLGRVESALGLKDRAAATVAKHRQAAARGERIQALKDAIRARPGDPEPQWKLGQVAAEGGLTTLAQNSYRAALALDPQCAPARAGLAALGSR